MFNRFPYITRSNIRLGSYFFPKDDTSVETYELTQTTTAVYEGESVTITLTTQGLADGVNVPYTISGIGITASDFVGLTSLEGDFTINDNTASVTLTLIEDFIIEYTEAFNLSLDNGEAETSIILVDDTSYILSAPESVNEGESIVIDLLTEGVPNGTLVPYTITGVSSEDIGGVSLTGNFIVGTTDLITLNVTEDALTEGDETLTLTLDNGQDTIDVTIVDTSIDPTYTLSGSTTVNEGDIISIQLDTTDVNGGTTVPYTITGVSSEDINGASLTGVFVVGTTDLITFTVTEDALTEGDEILTLTLDNGRASIDVNIVDTSLTQTYTLSSNPETINSGDSVTITLNTENVSDGSIVDYTISGDVIPSDLGLVELTGSFTINNNTSELILISDSNIDIDKTFVLSLDNVDGNIFTEVTIIVGGVFTYTFPIQLANNS